MSIQIIKKANYSIKGVHGVLYTLPDNVLQLYQVSKNILNGSELWNDHYVKMCTWIYSSCSLHIY